MKTKTLYISHFLIIFVVLTGILAAADPATTKKKRKKKAPPKPVATATVRTPKPMAAKVVSQSTSKKFTPAVATSSKTFRPRVRRAVYSPWDEPTYADSTVGDNVDGEDLDVRRAAVAALGPFNGAVVV